MANIATQAMTGLATARPIVAAMIQAARPDPVLGVADWAEQRRYVSENSGSPRPGKWSNAVTPFAVEIMNCLDPEHPARTVTLKCAAQLVKSEVVLNFIGWTIDADPAPKLLVQPSLDEVRLWSATKFEPMVESTPSLRGKVFEVIERSKTASTTSTKKYRGGPLHVVSAGASKQLQAKSVKRIALDEVSEYPADAGDRGDPVEQAIVRADAHADAKILLASTPKELPGCRITQWYERGDQRQFYVACPDCGARQILLIAQIKAKGETAIYECAACAAEIPEQAKGAMLAGGVWLKTYGDDEDANPAPPAVIAAEDFFAWTRRGSAGRDPSFHLNQAYSPFKPWGRLLAEARDAESDPVKRKTFRQQKEGLAWDPAVDAPKHEELYEARGQFVTRGVVPAWACLITGAADVQNDRIEWAAYAWGPDRDGARFEWGVCEGDTLTDAPWLALANVLTRRFPGEATVPLGFDAFGVDSGGGAGRTAMVYDFVRRSPGVKALKGASHPRTLPLEEGRQGKVKNRAGRWVSAKIHLVGGWAVKKLIYAMLFRGVAAAAAQERCEAALHYTADTPVEHFRQLTAEVFIEPRSRRAGAIGNWEKLPGRANEQLDLATYAYALAWDKGLERWTAAEWAQLFAARAKPADDAPLLNFAARAMDAPAPIAAGPGAPPQSSGPAAGDADAAKSSASPPTAKAGAALPANPGAGRPAWLDRLAKHNQKGKPPS